MEEISLQALLEAGCHFGHKSERWNPKASDFIYTEKDGIHIIDLAKTKLGLEEAVEFVKTLIAGGGELLFVATKRQAKGVVKEEVLKVGAPHLVEKWIGGFLTNWEQIKKNIDKILRLESEQVSGAWKVFPKHEQVKLARYLSRLKVFYAGVLSLKKPPQALFIVDVKKEDPAVREALRIGIPIVAIVDTNADPTQISHPIPANDDAVGSITYISKVIAQAYAEGKAILAKKEGAEAAAKKKSEEAKVVAEGKIAEAKPEEKQAVKPAAKPKSKKA